MLPIPQASSNPQKMPIEKAIQTHVSQPGCMGILLLGKISPLTIQRTLKLMQNSEKAEFNSWLKNRLKEVDLTADELAQFTKWLDERTKEEEAEHNKFVEGSKPVSTKEFLELFSWLKTRFKDQNSKF